MNRHELLVPYGIKYISDWKDYNFPRGHCIVDKGVTGCGYTEYCLRNDKNVVLCSPRKMLLENKSKQHLNDKNILYLENDIKDLVTRENFEQKISKHISDCLFLKLPIKFLVTYDSAHYIIDYLKTVNRLDDFYIVADEFQSIFLDSYFKAEIENGFLENSQQANNLIYLSATPMLDKYLEMLNEFKDLDYYSINWRESGYVETIQIQHKRTNSLFEEAKKIITKYLREEFPVMVDEKDKSIHFSKEAVLFFNSVSEIKRLIVNIGLKPEEVNILCSDTPSNKKLFKKIGFELGEIPLENEPRKMFTFCTSTVYIGADFYSDNASTYVFADPNLACLALDISMDLPQIVGRQRDRKNPFKNNITVFYKTTRENNLSDRKQFDELQATRKRKTEWFLEIYSNANEEARMALIEKCRSDVEVNKYCNDFVSISSRHGDIEYNKLIEIANERAWEVSQEDYKDSINVTRALQQLDSTKYPKEYRDEDDKIVDEFLKNKFFSTGIFEDKMEMFCHFMDDHREDPYIINMLKYKITDPKYYNFYNYFGTTRCKAMKYREINLIRALLGRTKNDILLESVYNRFELGKRYNSKTIKIIISDIYKGLKLFDSPKATDIKKWFEVKDVNIPDPITGKRDKGYELLSRKDHCL